MFLSFTIEDFQYIPLGFWIGLIIAFSIIYFLVYKFAKNKLLPKDDSDDNFFNEGE